MRCEKIRGEIEGTPNFLHAVSLFPERENEKGERALLAIGLAVLEMSMGVAPFKFAEMAKEAFPGNAAAEKDAFYVGLRVSNKKKLTLEEALKVVKDHIYPHWEKRYPVLDYDYVAVPGYGVHPIKLYTCADPARDSFYVSVFMFAPNDEARVDRLHKRIQEILDSDLV